MMEPRDPFLCRLGIVRDLRIPPARVLEAGDLVETPESTERNDVVTEAL
jgi:hypothetical protein